MHMITHPRTPKGKNVNEDSGLEIGRKLLWELSVIG